MDALIIGCGLSGAVIARLLAEEQGKKVVIWERRNHIAGNMYDYNDEHGILVHKYGPHTFHTQKKELYEFMCRFGKWQDYKLNCMAYINQHFTPTPFNFQTIDDYYSKEEAEDLKNRIQAEFGERKKATVLEVLQSKDKKIRAYAEFLYDNDYKLYTAKQWGIDPSEIDPSVLKRVPLNFSYDKNYFDDLYQIMPADSYTSFFENLLDHPNIEVKLGVEAFERLKIEKSKILIDDAVSELPVIYTGALDELFELKYGRLPYRSLRFDWKYEDIDSKQEAAVVAYPQEKGFTRITEYKKLPHQEVKGTTYAVEYPLAYDGVETTEPYYPVLTEASRKSYAAYLLEASQVANLYLSGRLADFKYYNMDNALERALEVYGSIEGKK